MAAGTCAAPISVSDCDLATLTVDTGAAVTIADPASCASSATGRKGIVIEYTPSRTGFLTATVLSATLDAAAAAASETDMEFDTVLFARSACPGAGDSEIGCNDDGGEERNALLEIESVQAGTPIYIVLQGFGENDYGTADLEIQVGDGPPPPPPATGMCTGTDITMVTGNSHTVSLVGNGPEQVRVPAACSGPCSGNEAGDAVLQYTPDRDGMLTITTDNPGTTERSDTLLAVFSDCTGAEATSIMCDDDSGGELTADAEGAMTRSLSALLTVPVTSGVPIFVGVDLCRAMTTVDMMEQPIMADVEITFTFE